MNVYDLLTDQTALESRRGKIYGAVVGLVTNNQDPEGLTRVKVQFPWLTDEEESHWARVASFAAGAGRGAYFLPEVGDEVLVLFDHGDVRFPYVVGALWNGADAAPRDNGDGANNQRVFTSRSGHEIVLDDSAGAGQVEVHTAGGHRILMDDTPGSAGITVEDSGGNRVQLDSVSGSVSVEAQTRLSISAPMIEIAADTALKLSAGATLEIQGALVKIN